MPIDPNADIEITSFAWVPDFARGFVRDLRPRWACEEAGIGYCERLIGFETAKGEAIAASSPSARCRRTATTKCRCSRAARWCCVSPSVPRR